MPQEVRFTCEPLPHSGKALEEAFSKVIANGRQHGGFCTAEKRSYHGVLSNQIDTLNAQVQLAYLKFLQIAHTGCRCCPGSSDSMETLMDAIVQDHEGVVGRLHSTRAEIDGLKAEIAQLKGRLDQINGTGSCAQAHSSVQSVDLHCTRPSHETLLVDATGPPEVVATRPSEVGTTSKHGGILGSPQRSWGISSSTSSSRDALRYRPACLDARFDEESDKSAVGCQAEVATSKAATEKILPSEVATGPPWDPALRPAQYDPAHPELWPKRAPYDPANPNKWELFGRPVPSPHKELVTGNHGDIATSVASKDGIYADTTSTTEGELTPESGSDPTDTCLSVAIFKATAPRVRPFDATSADIPDHDCNHSVFKDATQRENAIKHYVSQWGLSGLNPHPLIFQYGITYSASPEVSIGPYTKQISKADNACRMVCFYNIPPEAVLCKVLAFVAGGQITKAVMCNTMAVVWFEEGRNAAAYVDFVHQHREDSIVPKEVVVALANSPSYPMDENTVEYLRRKCTRTIVVPGYSIAHLVGILECINLLFHDMLDKIEDIWVTLDNMLVVSFRDIVYASRTYDVIQSLDKYAPIREDVYFLNDHCSRPLAELLTPSSAVPAARGSTLKPDDEGRLRVMVQIDMVKPIDGIEVVYHEGRR